METYALAVLISLLTAGGSQDTSRRGCRLDDVALQRPQNEFQRREVYLGFILPVHHYDPVSQMTCGIIDERDILHLEAFFWAISTYNVRHNLTVPPPARLRGVAFDSCGSSDRFYQRLDEWTSCRATPEVAKSNTLAFLGYDSGAVTGRGAKLFNRTNTIFINLSPHSPLLERKLYPRYYQLSPSVEQETDAIIGLIETERLRNVKVVYIDDEYGRSALSSFSAKAADAGIDVTSVHYISPRADDNLIQMSLNAMQRTNTGILTVVVVFAYGKQKAKIHDVLGDGFIIISTGNLDDYGRRVATSNLGIVLTYRPRQAVNNWIQEFDSYLAGLTLNRTDVSNPWFSNYFKQKFECENQCAAGQTFGDAADPSPAPTALIIEAVDLVIAAFQEAAKSCPFKPDCPGYGFSSLEKEFQTEVAKRLRDEGGVDPSTNTLDDWDYNVYKSKVQGKEVIYTYMGSIRGSNSGTEVSIEPLTDVSAAAHGTRWGQGRGHGWVIAIGVLAGLGILLVVLTAIVIILLLHRAVRVSYVVLYAILLFGAFLGYLTLFAFIPNPTTATCGITRFGIGLSYAICLSVMVVIGLIMFKKVESSYALRIFIYCVFALLVAVEIVILIMWFILVPPGEVLFYAAHGYAVWGCSHYTYAPPVFRTAFENHLLALIYIMVLILLLLILGVLLFMKRNKMKDRLLKIEATLLLVAGVGCTLLWITWALVGGLLKNHQHAQQFADGALAFGLWCILTLLVLLLLVQLWFYWKKSNGKLDKRTTTTSPLHNTVPVMTTIENRHVIDNRRDDNIITTTTTTTTAATEAERPITIIENKQGPAMEMNRVEDLRVNHGGRANGNVVVTKQTKKEIHTHTEGHGHPREAERYSAHLSQAKLSGASDNLGHHHHHHHHHSSSQHPNSSFFCSECGYAIDPNALHLKHPRSERSSTHNTSVYVAETSGHLANGDTSFAHSDGTPHVVHEHHPIYTKNPYGVYSTPSIYYSNRRPESIYSTNPRVMRISRELTGRPPSRYGMSFSEYDRIGYPKRSFRRTKSEEQLGSL